MNDQFPNLKKEMDHITVPVDKLESIILETARRTKMKRSRKHVVLYAVSAAVVSLVLFISSAMVSPAMAKVASKIPVVGTFFNDIGDEGLRIVGEKGLSQVVDQTAKDHGITLTINEVFYDGTRLAIGYSQDSLLPLGEVERPVIEVDGKEINFSSGYSGEYETPQKYRGILDITPSEELPEEFEMTIRIDAVGLIPGEWFFQFPVRQSNEVKVISLSDIKKTKDAKISLNSLKIGPAGTTLNVNIIAEPGKIDPYSLGFYLIDDKGKVLNMVSGSGSGKTIDGKEHANLQQLFEPLDEGVRSVKVIPYNMYPSQEMIEEKTINLKHIQLPIMMSNNNMDDIIINDIQYEENRTVVYFEVSESVIDDPENHIWLEELSGEKLGPLGRAFGVRIEGNRFKQEFGPIKKEELMLKEYKMEMPIFEIELP
jgi:hypothetical protein